MKKFAFVSVILVGFALMFTACGQKTEEVNVRMDLTKQSTLEKAKAVNKNDTSDRKYWWAGRIKDKIGNRSISLVSYVGG